MTVLAESGGRIYVTVNEIVVAEVPFTVTILTVTCVPVVEVAAVPLRTAIWPEAMTHAADAAGHATPDIVHPATASG